MVAIAALNIYVEQWPSLKRIDFQAAAILLLIGFLWPYTALSMGLMELLGITGRRQRFVSSFLPLIYALALSFAMILPSLKTLESPPLGLYMFIVLMAVIHIPAFAAGKSRAMKVRRDFSAFQATNSNRHPPLLKTPILALASPLLIILILQITMRDDWRLFGLNAVLTAAIASLFVVVRRTD